MLIYRFLLKNLSFYDFFARPFAIFHCWEMIVTVATVINPGHGWQTSKTVVYRGLT